MTASFVIAPRRVPSYHTGDDNPSTLKTQVIEEQAKSAVSRTLEPRAAALARRFRTIRTLTDEGIPVEASIAQAIPFVTESDLERIMAAAAEAGAINASYVALRLPWEVSPLFQHGCKHTFPTMRNAS